MTPKQKAKELFDKYATYVVMWKGDINTTHQNCKQCALIAVDEILNLSKIASLRRDEVYMELEYWTEIKQEIEKL
jgi:hypothetical protein